MQCSTLIRQWRDSSICSGRNTQASAEHLLGVFFLDSSATKHRELPLRSASVLFRTNEVTQRGEDREWAIPNS